MNTDWIQYVLVILSGVVTATPLVIKLIEYVRKAVQEKNWPGLMSAVMQYMEVAEQKFETGMERKQFVMAMVQQSAELVNYEIDMEVVSAMIDQICATSKIVNAPEGDAK